MSHLGYFRALKIVNQLKFQALLVHLQRYRCFLLMKYFVNVFFSSYLFLRLNILGRIIGINANRCKKVNFKTLSKKRLLIYQKMHNCNVNEIQLLLDQHGRCVE